MYEYSYSIHSFFKNCCGANTVDTYGMSSKEMEMMEEYKRETSIRMNLLNYEKLRLVSMVY